MALSDLTPTFSSPVRIAISTSSVSLLDSARLSCWCSAPNIALVSLSSGSAIPSLSAAVRTCFRPTTGPRIAVLIPRSLSRSTVITSVRVINPSPGYNSPDALPIHQASPEL